MKSKCNEVPFNLKFASSHLDVTESIESEIQRVIYKQLHFESSLSNLCVFV